MKKSAWGFIENKGKYLFIQRSLKTSGPGQWCVPGGGCKPNESVEQACIREVFEEVGIKVKVNNLIYQDESFVYFQCQPLTEDFVVKLCFKECKSYQWVKLNELLELGSIMELKRLIKVLPLIEIGLDLEIPEE